MLVDRNMDCRSNADQRDHFPRIHLDVSLFLGIYQICIPCFPFDLPMQSGTITDKLNTVIQDAFQAIWLIPHASPFSSPFHVLAMSALISI